MARRWVGCLTLCRPASGVVFAAVRGPKVRVTVRLSQALCDRLREALDRLNLKVTDFACTALDRYLAPLEGS